ncbi:MAG: hypothetical protein Q9174_004068 [Haloplaca sp. 1 TL-2023]
MASKEALAQGVNLARSFAHAGNQYTSSLSELQVFDQFSQPYFLRAFEGGQNDCGIYVGDALPGGTMTDRLFELRHHQRERRVVLPLEIKTLSPISNGHGALMWEMLFSKEQMDNTQAVIVTTPFEPEYFAFVPMKYLQPRQMSDLERWHVNMQGQRPLWTVHAPPGFPPELAPFIIPASQLGVALESMRDYAMGNTDAWVNVHTGVDFEVDRPQAFPIDVLEPSWPPWQMALAQIDALHGAFQLFSKDWRVELVDVFPMLGDFKFVHIASGTEVLVEAKRAHCKFLLDGGDQSFMTHVQNPIVIVETRHIFCWKAQWDFIYTQSKDDVSGALFLPKDEIPESWWNSSEPTLVWPLEQIGNLRKYHVSTMSTAETFRDIVAILNRRLHQIHAQKRIAVDAALPEPLEEAKPKVRSVPPAKQPRNEEAKGERPNSKKRVHREVGWDSSAYQRGFGSSLHPQLRGDTYEVWAAEALREVCRRWCGKGAGIRPGRAQSLEPLFHGQARLDH